MFKWFKKPRTQQVKTVKAVVHTPVRMPELTMRQPYTGGTRWTEDEDNIVKSFYNLGVKPAYISEALTKAGYERSAAAVTARVHKLNKLAQE